MDISTFAKHMTEEEFQFLYQHGKIFYIFLCNSNVKSPKDTKNFKSNHRCPQLSCLKNIPGLSKHTYTVNMLVMVSVL